MNIKFYLSEMLVIFKKSLSEFIFLSVVYFISLLIFSGITQGYFYLSKLLNETLRMSYMKVFLLDETTEKDVKGLQIFARNLPYVDTIRFISKEMASVEFSEKFPKYKGLLSLFPESPFPPNLEVRLNEKILGNDNLERLVEFYSKYPIVTSVQHNYSTVLRLFEIKRSMAKAGLLLLFFFLFFYVPLNISFIKSIFLRERKFFDFVELSGFDKRGLELTFVGAVFIPFLLVSLLNYLIFRIISNSLQISFFPVATVILFFLALQLLFSIDVLEK